MTNAELITKIKAEIERRILYLDKYKDITETSASAMQELIYLQSFIESMEKQQPKTGYISNPCSACVNDNGCVTCKNYNMMETQPQGLDEAAEEWSKIFISEDCKEACNYGFRVGAKWAFGQGETIYGTIFGGDGYLTCETNNLSKNTLFKYGDKVIVQIRKCDE